MKGLPELIYPVHDSDKLVTTCGRICMHRKKINISTALDQHDFWLNQPKIIKLIGFNMLERNAGAKPRTLLLIPLQPARNWE